MLDTLFFDRRHQLLRKEAPQKIAGAASTFTNTVEDSDGGDAYLNRWKTGSAPLQTHSNSGVSDRKSSANRITGSYDGDQKAISTWRRTPFSKISTMK
ncbi:MAG: hypothetical protein R3C68_07405 [Myxococcota bacterium]